jgi:hypothetical protein
MTDGRENRGKKEEAALQPPRGYRPFRKGSPIGSIRRNLSQDRCSPGFGPACGRDIPSVDVLLKCKPEAKLAGNSQAFSPS